MKVLKLHQYIPTNSVIHNLKPELKLMLFVLQFIMMFSVQSLPAMLCAIVGLIVFVWQTKVPLAQYGKLLSRLKWLFTFLVVMNLFFYQQGVVLLDWSFITIYSGAIQQTLRICFQLSFMMIAAGWMMYTTTPLQLMSGIDWYLRPLQYVGVKTEKMMLILFIVFRFIPILLQDLEQLQYAQASRGAYIYNGNLRQRLQAFPSLLIPLFESALAHGQQNAKMLIARRYDNFQKFQPLMINSSKMMSVLVILQHFMAIFVIFWFNFQGIPL